MTINEKFLTTERIIEIEVTDERFDELVIENTLSKTYTDDYDRIVIRRSKKTEQELKKIDVKEPFWGKALWLLFLIFSLIAITIKFIIDLFK